MYRLFRSKTVDGKANGLLARKVFGTPLGSHWLAGAGPLSAHGLVFAGLLVLLAGAAFMAARAARQPVMAASGGPAAPAAGPPAALGRILPYSTVVIAAFVPLAAGLYLLTTTAWTLAERAVLRRITSARDGASGPAALPAGSARSAR
jgi:YidC/Oxa1 family membrane protein insertase